MGAVSLAVYADAPRTARVTPTFHTPFPARPHPPLPVPLPPPDIRAPARLLAVAVAVGGVLVLASLASSLDRAAASERAADAARDSLRALQRDIAADRTPANAAVGGARTSADPFDIDGLVPPVQGFVSRGVVPSIGHYGVDVPLAENTPVRAVADGRVVLADGARAGGETLVVAHAGGRVSVYKHNARLLVAAGDSVRAGQVVARSGNTGALTSGPHLHVELWRDGVPLDLRRLVSPR